MTPDLSRDLSGLSKDDWFQALDELGEEHGYLERLGDEHAALFIDAGTRLLVTFELRSAAQARPNGAPLGFDLVTRNGWSLLTILAEDSSWFRGARLYGFIDRLIDDGFFEDFDNVLFYGAHQGGYAAGAFSVAAPGATVLMMRPVATLDPAYAGWDRRYPEARRKDFNSRFGYAPDMIDAVEEAFVCFDPTMQADAIHAALFRRSNVTALPCRLARPRIEVALESMDCLFPLIEHAMAGTLTNISFAKLWRARRDSQTYLRTLLKRLEVDERPGLAARLCRYGLGTSDAGFFEERLAKIEAAATRQKVASA
ncbi:hypothetical protein [Flavimaricola marinus]|uniref:Phosphoadenosine phosphosulfate reductase n=1 Tax=Flavimaricola marinus TaxID=1819565 RepID=A0A238LDQ3_9RHOB|nr:hypothetical protein [Flavimaricola marinus]SMY07847.1 hypothetical protein LOM8899_01987 [Flavimaricola marinus]